MLRIGIAGLGGMGTVHARNACALVRGTLVAVASTRHARGSEVARELGVRSVPTTSCSQPTTSTQSSSRRARSTTPVSRSLLYARASTSSSRSPAPRRSPTTSCSSPRQTGDLRGRPGRLPPSLRRRFVEARRLVAAGAIGDPLLVLATSRDVRTPEPEDPVPAGGFLVDMASHDYDAACWLLGEEPVELFAAASLSVFPELGSSATSTTPSSRSASPRAASR